MKKTVRFSKEQDFPDWFNNVVLEAGVIDNRYPLKGFYVWKPHGFKMLKKMMAIMERLLEDAGHQEVYFPSLVPTSVFSKESDFLAGFGGDALVVTRTGKKELDEALILRPTSETVMYYMFALWIKGKSDLPLKLYQTVNVFRYETKQTRPLLRVREIVKFKEAHTVHATAEEAAEQVKQAIAIYKQFFSSLLLPFKVLKTPQWDTFAGAEYNYDFITVLPDGKALELGSVINLGQKFAKAFNITFMDEEGKQRYVYQTCYGISERSLGAVIAIHSDDKGLRLPSSITPIPVVVIPIVKKGDTSAVLDYADKLGRELGCFVDKSDKSPGEKFYYWDVRGVIVKLVVGSREVEERTVSVKLRTGEQLSIPVQEVKDRISQLIERYDEQLKRQAQQQFERFVKVSELEEAKKQQRGLVGVYWCGDESCGKALEQELDRPALGSEQLSAPGRCAVCGKETNTVLYFGRTY
jgi:prolyl-tRNA synthetase